MRTCVRCMGLYGAAIQQYSGCDHTAPYSRIAARSPRDLFGALAYGVAHSKRRLYGPLYGQHTLCGPHKRSMDRSTHALWTRALRNRTESGRIGRPSWPTGRPYSPYSAPSHTDHTTRNGCIIQHTAHTRPHAVWSAVTIQHTAHTAILPYSQPSACGVVPPRIGGRSGVNCHVVLTETASRSHKHVTHIRLPHARPRRTCSLRRHRVTTPTA